MVGMFLLGAGMVLMDPFRKTSCETFSQVTTFASWFYPVCNFVLFCVVQASLLEYWAVPDFTTVCMEVAKFVLGVVLSNTVFYMGHWLLHRRCLYRFHAMHHLYIVPTPRAALYMHPLELFLGPLLTIGLPIVLLRPFRPVAYVTTLLAMIQAVRSHSSGPGFHQTHHATQRINLGFKNAVLDNLCGTHQCEP